ncbi:CPBP family intramembrane glutamic endopeptidase [Desemzia sp. FAM 23989]|uniref:CPBP family intramembrane glutamic endopeptidase n=1 Tax=Desemzia sp. FAM 23989 TaxID=3259523 RepID=UPI003884D44B
MEFHHRQPMFPTLFWLILYLLLATFIGNYAQTDREVYLIGAVPQLLLASLCFLYLYRTGLSTEIGLTTPATESNKIMLYYLPLFFISGISLFYGFQTSLPLLDVLALLGLYTAVSFMEEVIFRGLMFNALSRKWKHLTVVLFISSTFAFGHIISLVATQMTGYETSLQIMNAFVVGFLFMVVMISSRNLKVCILAHILYNFLASISNVGSTRIEVVVVTTIIAVLYTAYLWKNAIHLKGYLNERAVF